MSIALTDTSVVIDNDIQPTARPHGLLSVLQTVNAASGHWIYGGFDLEFVCGGAGTTSAFCLSEDVPPVDKTPFSNEWPHLSPLAIYAIHECPSIGKQWATRLEDAKEALLIGRESALETHFAGLAVADATTQTATDLTEALIAAEEIAGYDAGRVIHLTPGAALRLSDYLGTKDGRMTTKIGTPVVVGLGYVGAIDDSVLVTGIPLGAEGEVVTSETVLNTANNLVSVLAEQPYALGYACGATLITVTP